MTSFCLFYEVGALASLLFLSFYAFGNYALSKNANGYSFYLASPLRKVESPFIFVVSEH